MTNAPNAVGSRIAIDWVKLVDMVLVWLLLAFAETGLAYYLGRAPIYNSIKIANTRRAVLEPNAAYFAGMFFGDVIRLIPVIILIGHTVWIFRKRIFRESPIAPLPSRHDALGQPPSQE